MVRTDSRSAAGRFLFSIFLTFILALRQIVGASPAGWRPLLDFIWQLMSDKNRCVTDTTVSCHYHLFRVCRRPTVSQLANQRVHPPGIRGGNSRTVYRTCIVSLLPFSHESRLFSCCWTVHINNIPTIFEWFIFSFIHYYSCGCLPDIANEHSLFSTDNVSYCRWQHRPAYDTQEDSADCFSCAALHQRTTHKYCNTLYGVVQEE